MKTPHKHAELIKAWADGAEIEVRELYNTDWGVTGLPMWRDYFEYRIKPELKPNTTRPCRSCDGTGQIAIAEQPITKEQEPVGHLYTIAGVQHCTIERVLPDGPLYTSPPKREPLEKREIMNALMSVDPATKRLTPGFEQFARAIEAAHGIKELNA